MRLLGFELAWAKAAFEAIFPEGTALPHGIARMNPARFLADAIHASGFEQAVGLRVTLWIIALAPLWFLRRPKTIASIEPTDRQRVLELLLASPVYAVRQLVVAFKALGSMRFAQSPELRDAMTTPRETLWESGTVQIRKKPRVEAPATPANDVSVGNEWKKAVGR